MESRELIFIKDLIQFRLRDYESPERLIMQHVFFINSAVLFLIVPYRHKPYDLVLIKRTKRENDKHSGEMSFPGGKFDPNLDKDYLDTALRELDEELGIPRSKVRVIGCIDDHLTPKGYIITPFVAYIKENQQMLKQDGEVKEIVKIPITFFSNKENYKEKTFFLKNELIGVGRFNYKSPENKRYVIFGATSHIIVNYIERVYNLRLTAPGSRRARIDDIKDKIVK